MDTQIGLLGGKYSLALDDGSAFNSYNLMLTILLLYLANVISHDFFLHFDTSFSSSARLKMSREKSVSREISPLTYPLVRYSVLVWLLMYKSIYAWLS
jgi:hypothetical protein